MGLSAIRRKQINTLLRRYGSFPRQVSLTLILSWLAAVLYHSSVGTMGNIQTLRLFFFLRGPIAPPEDVVIVAVDDKSFKELAASTSYPLPRRYLATALDSIVEASPRTLVVDGKFPDDRVYDVDSDERIAEAFAKLPTTIWKGRDDDRPDTEVLPSGEHFRKAAKMELDMFITGAQGYLFGASDSTGRFLKNPRDPVTPTSSLEAKQRLKAMSTIGYALVELGGYSIVPPTANSFINFYGASKSIPYVSLVDLIMGDIEAAKAKISGKVVLFGYLSKQYMKGILNRDEFVVPSDPSGMFGVEIHSHLVGNLIHQQWIDRMRPRNEVLFVVLLTIAFAAAALRKPTPSVIGFILLTPLVLLAIGYFSFVYFRFFIPGIPIIALMSYLITAPSIIHFLLRSQRFNNYLNKQLKIETEQEI
ncbi:CHASE2 domain-containing protein [Pirellulaceae bacterium SH449]